MDLEPPQFRLSEPLLRDYRLNHKVPNGSNGRTSSPIRIITWNIEMGYELESIIEELRRLDADILCLQEVDIFTGRTEGGKKLTCSKDLEGLKKDIDCCEVIAKALGLNSLAVPEMVLDDGGVMCNAILTKFDFFFADSLKHSGGGVGFDPKGRAYGRGEGREKGFPRLGLRTAARAILATPIGKVLVHSDHFEMHKCDTRGRLIQLKDLLKSCDELKDRSEVQILAGDFNTFEHALGKV